MNIFKQITLMSSLAFSVAVFAHSDGHGKVNTEKVIELAQTSAKMLSFKDHGMSVGKIDKSWSDMAKEQFKVVEEKGANYIVKAINTKTNETLYFEISKAGEIKAVTKRKASNKSHGHSH